MKPFEYELKRAYSFELKGKQLALYSFDFLLLYVRSNMGKGQRETDIFS